MQMEVAEFIGPYHTSAAVVYPEGVREGWLWPAGAYDNWGWCGSGSCPSAACAPRIGRSLGGGGRQRVQQGGTRGPARRFHSAPCCNQWRADHYSVEMMA